MTDTILSDLAEQKLSLQIAPLGFFLFVQFVSFRIFDQSNFVHDLRCKTEEAS